MIVTPGGPHEGLLESLDALCGRIVFAASQPSARAIEGARSFPAGMCTWASLAGAVLLEESGFGPWGTWNAAQSDHYPRHDWLVQGDLFVDLTAHQFEGFEEHLVGVGANPLAARFPMHLATYPSSDILEHDTIVRWKLCLEEVVGLGGIG